MKLNLIQSFLLTAFNIFLVVTMIRFQSESTPFATLGILLFLITSLQLIAYLSTKDIQE